MSEPKKRGRKLKAKTADASQRTLLTHFTRSEVAHTSEPGNDTVDSPSGFLVDANASEEVTNDSTPVLDIDSSPEVRTVPLASVDNVPSTEAGPSTRKKKSLRVAASQSSNGERPKSLFPLFQPKSTAMTTTDDDSELDTNPPTNGTRQHTASSDMSGRSSPPASSPVSVALDLTSDNEGTELAPIVIDSSPIRLPRRTTLRSPSVQLLDVPSHPARKRRRRDTPPDAPLPDLSSQHVLNSPRTRFTPSSCPLPRRGKENQPPTQTFDSTIDPTSSNELAFLGISLQPPYTEPGSTAAEEAQSTSPDLGTISLDFNQYPAVARLSDPALRSRDTDEDQQQTWAEKWRPRRAEEILGNEWPACYLRDWMDALRLHYTAPPASTPPSSQPQGSQSKAKGGKKSLSRNGSLRGSQGPRGSQGRGTKRKAAGPTVVREVARKPKRARRELDDFMVSDEDDAMTDVTESAYTGVDFGDDDDLGIERGGSFVVDPSAPPPGAAPVPATPFVFEGSIRNTMVLVGPPGSGKTAAVYACAEELGWAVFEVHPGIGKRGAAQLDALVGDVGRNHTLAPAATQSTAKTVFSMLARGKTPQSDTTKVGESPTEKVAPTQSIVLFEEVDVLFAEDASFWNALISFIKESRRPVVLTCNDVSLVPTTDLPLERVVEFKRPSADLARAAVRGVCVAERQRVPRAAATPLARVGGVDVRQALHQSQLGLGLALPDHAHVDDGGDRHGGRGMLVDHTLFEPAGAIERQHPGLEALRQAERTADAACFVDAYLARPDQSALTMLELAESHADDEVGLRAICTVRRHTAPVGDAFYSADEAVARAAGWSYGDEGSSEDGEGYIDRLVTVLEKSRVPGHRLADRRGLVLDYGPWLREMGRVEEADAAAAAVEASSGRRGLRGRQTANSTGRRAMVGERWRELEATGLEFGII